MKLLVTGGAGFLGTAIVLRLLERGDTVRLFQRHAAPELEESGATVVCGDITDADAVVQAAEGCDVVVHTAAKAGVWGSRREYNATNIDGTRNVIEACLRQRIDRLVFTSSPSAVFSGNDEEGIDETAPYPKRYLAEYPRTKAAAERMVLAANDSRLATVALRPHLIWGPCDPHLVPRIVDRARAGRLRLIGDKKKLVDSTYIDNAAEAHLLAVDRLHTSAACAGKAYFISNGEPLPMADLINRILVAAHLPRETRTLSPRVAYIAGTILEWSYRLFDRLEEPPMTRFVAKQLSTAHWFDCSAAKRDLDYQPSVSIEEGMRRLEAYLATSSCVETP